MLEEIKRRIRSLIYHIPHVRKHSPSWVARNGYESQRISKFRVFIQKWF